MSDRAKLTGALADSGLDVAGRPTESLGAVEEEAATAGPSCPDGLGMVDAKLGAPEAER